MEEGANLVHTGTGLLKCGGQGDGDHNGTCLRVGWLAGMNSSGTKSGTSGGFVYVGR